MVHQYGVSIQSSTKVRETFRQITQKLWATKPETFVYKLVFYNNISFSWLLPLDGFQHIFLLRDSENDLLLAKANNYAQSPQMLRKGNKLATDKEQYQMS